LFDLYDRERALESKPIVPWQEDQVEPTHKMVHKFLYVEKKKFVNNSVFKDE
jgi:hypothetical protein